MLWFEGSVTEAISKVKKERKVFLVFIEGDDELSQQMLSTYNDPQVSDRLGDCVAIKLKAKSEPCQQFSQIYPVVVVPSSFFIGMDGIPLEITAGSLEPRDFIGKIEQTLKLHEEKCNSENQEEVQQQAQTVPAPQSEAIQLLQSDAASIPDIPEPVSTESHKDLEKPSASVSEASGSKGTTDKIAEEAGGQSDEAQSDATMEEKLERAKELIELRRIQKAKEEEEKERESELERRRTMKEVQKARQQQQENDMKEWAQSRAREKEEEKLARERVLAQIAQDRAERAARYQKEKAEELRRQQTALEERLKREQEEAAALAAQKSQFARIQFRMPDGSSVTHQFPADSTLQDIYNFVVQEVRPPFSSFSLSTTFPRRQFQRSDYGTTLRNLQLAPSAAVLVVPERRLSVPSSHNRSTWDFLWLLLAPLVMAWSFISSFIFGGTTSQSSSSPPATENNNPKRKQEREDRSRRSPSTETGSSGSESDQGTSRKRRTGDDSSFYRREGNIYRLTTRRSDDDENNTWNGNSTQQM